MTVYLLSVVYLKESRNQYALVGARLQEKNKKKEHNTRVIVKFALVIILSAILFLFSFIIELNNDAMGWRMVYGAFLDVLSLILMSIQNIPQMITTFKRKKIGALSLITTCLGVLLQFFSIFLFSVDREDFYIILVQVETTVFSFLLAGECLLFEFCFVKSKFRDRLKKYRRSVTKTEKTKLIQ